MFIQQPSTSQNQAASSHDARRQSQESLRVLYVLDAFPVLSETFISNEIRAMRAAGHVAVPLALTRYDGACQPQDEMLRAETLLLSDISRAEALASLWRFHPRHLRDAWRFCRAQTGMTPRSLMLAALRTAILARRLGCRHLHAHFALASAATAITAAKIAGLRASFTGHGYDVYGTPADLALKLRHADVAIAVCEDMRRDFLSLQPQAKVALVHCGIDPALFRPRDAAAGELRCGKILAIGRLAEQKGYDVLLRALALLPQAQRPQIDVVGAGALEESLRAMVRDLGLDGSVTFLGPRPAAWIAANGPHYLGFVAPYCITANGDRDTGPVVAKEAMAMGLPVLASALMGLREIVTPACGRQVPPRDVAALAEGLVWLANLSEAERRRMGAAGRQHVQTNFSLAGQAAGLACAIRQAA